MPTRPQDMIAAIEQALADLPIGVDEVVVDGQRTKWSRARALEELEYWRQRHSRQTRSRFSAVHISGGG